MDTECLSSWRRAGLGINRRPPSPQGHLCSQSPLRLLYSWKCVWKPSHGANGQGNARMCAHTHAHTLLSVTQGTMKEETPQNAPTRTMRGYTSPSGHAQAKGDPGSDKLLSAWTESGSYWLHPPHLKPAWCLRCPGYSSSIFIVFWR